MALVVFLRGVNVGGYRAFRPSVLAKRLRSYDVVNVGAAGTFVVRKPGLRARFLAALRRKLPFETTIIGCDSREIERALQANPFGARRPRTDTVRFATVFSKLGRAAVLPKQFPPAGTWFVRILGSQGRFVFGMYRRHMKTIGYLGQLDKRVGASGTTRNWNTILAIQRILRGKALSLSG